MGWVEILPSYASLFRQRRWESASAFLAWTGILVNRHRHREVEQVGLADDAATARRPVSAKPQVNEYYIKKEYAVSWRDRFRNAWHGFGWCATAVREGAILQALRRAGVGCPDVVALGEDGRAAFVVTRAETAMTELREILPMLDGAQRRRLAEALGRELARMHDAGFDHPDLFAKHILVSPEPFRFCILDWQRGRRRRSLSLRLRVRGLSVLDATLHESLASARLRLLLLRSYLGACRGAPVARLARSIRQLAVALRHRRNIREVGQLPTPARDQQFVRAGPLLVVRSFWEEHDGRLPDWLLQSAKLDRPAGELARGELPPLAHTLFRLQRFGIAAPRLIAVNRSGGVYTQSVATVPLIEAFAKACTALRLRTVRQAGQLIGLIHEAGYRLPAGDCWEQRLGTRSDTGAVVLARVEPLERCDAVWQEFAPLEFSRSTLLLSRSEQMRFLQGYLMQRYEDDERMWRSTKRTFLPDSRPRERQAV